MSLTISLPLPKKILNLKEWDLFDLLLFLYFFTQHADLLSFVAAGFVVRLTDFIALGLALLFIVRMRSSLFSFDKPMIFSLLLMTFSIGLSCLNSDFFLRTLFFFIRWIALIVLHFLLPYQLMRTLDPKKILRFYFASFWLVGLYAMMQLLLSLVGIHDPFVIQTFHEGIARADAFCQEPSYYALYMCPFVILQATRFIMEKRSKKRIIAFIFLNFLFFLSTSTSTIFVYIAFFLVITPLTFTLFREHRKILLQLVKYLFLSLLSFSVIFPSTAQMFFLKFFTFKFVFHSSFIFRFGGIINAFRVFLEKPFFGIGLGAYPNYIFRRWLEGGSYIVFEDSNTIFSHAHPHKIFEATNVFSELLASLGVVGIFAIGFFAISFYRQFRKAFSISSLGKGQIWLIGFFLASVVMVMIFQISQSIFRPYLWTYLAIAWAYFSNYASRKKREGVL